MSVVSKIASCAVMAAVLAACAENGAAPVSTSAPSTTAEVVTSTQPPSATTPPPPPAITAPVTTTTQQPPARTLPLPVPEAGSVRDVISRRDDLTNINAAIGAWLADRDGRDGVLRNARGLTMFLPNDDGFTEDDVAIAVADFDAFTIFLSEHLRVGALSSSELGSAVTTAMGVTYPITDGPTIGGRLIVEADVEASNGVIHVIDGPLSSIG